ncbi:MAG: hypothetical protein V4509_00555 [Patescibacteria group bacterium]
MSNEKQKLNRKNLCCFGKSSTEKCPNHIIAQEETDSDREWNAQEERKECVHEDDGNRFCKHCKIWLVRFSSPTQSVEEKCTCNLTRNVYHAPDCSLYPRKIISEQNDVSPTQDWDIEELMKIDYVWLNRATKELTPQLKSFISQIITKERERLCAEILAKIHTMPSRTFPAGPGDKYQFGYIEAKRDIARIVKDFYLQNNEKN